jgi:hypothetical protein
MGTFQRDDDGCNNVLLPAQVVLGTELVVRFPETRLGTRTWAQPTQLESAGDFILPGGSFYFSLITLSYVVTSTSTKLLVCLESKSFPLHNKVWVFSFFKLASPCLFFLGKEKKTPLQKVSVFIFKPPHLFFLLKFSLNNFMSGILSSVEFFKSFF